MSGFDDAARLLRERAGGSIDFAVVLGTGLSDIVAGKLSDAQRIPYLDVGLRHRKLFGHAGEAHVGTWHGKRCLAFAGRMHLYQGFNADESTAPVGLAAAAGASTVVLTNAAGGLNLRWNPGDLMLIVDQVNLTGTSPLIGSDDPNPFVQMVDAYDPALCELARRRAAHHGIGLREGVYAGVVGPEFETPAEARRLRTFADAVGMSTVLETIRARKHGMRVLGMSLITNMVGAHTSHAEVVAAGNARAAELGKLLDAIAASL